MEPNILLFDIESSPNIGYTWGAWEQNVLAFIQESYMLCYSYKWNGGKTKVVSLPDFPDYKKDKTNDKALTYSLWELFNEADIIIAHNGDQFDIRYSNGRFLFHGFQPPTNYQTIDTLKIARKRFKLNSNKLDDLGRTLHIGRKVTHEGFGLWLKCMEGDERAWKRMRKYNKQDTELLYNVYQKLKPWHQNHPNLNVFYDDTRPACSTCRSIVVQRKGIECKGNTQRYRWKCQSCGANMYTGIKKEGILKTT